MVASGSLLLTYFHINFPLEKLILEDSGNKLEVVYRSAVSWYGLQKLIILIDLFCVSDISFKWVLEVVLQTSVQSSRKGCI